MTKLRKDFENQLKCQCGCGNGRLDQIHPMILKMLSDSVIALYVEKVSSGFRCEKHNAEVGGVKNSRHTKGEAFDIHLEDPKKVTISYLVKYYGLYIHKLIRYDWGLHISVKDFMPLIDLRNQKK